MEDREIDLVSKVTKASNKGYSTHERLLRLDNLSLAYYKKMPKDKDIHRVYTYEKPEPKNTVPLSAIIAVKPMNLTGDDVSVNEKSIN